MLGQRGGAGGGAYPTTRRAGFSHVAEGGGHSPQLSLQVRNPARHVETIALRPLCVYSWDACVESSAYALCLRIVCMSVPPADVCVVLWSWMRSITFSISTSYCSVGELSTGTTYCIRLHSIPVGYNAACRVSKLYPTHKSRAKRTISKAGHCRRNVLCRQTRLRHGPRLLHSNCCKTKASA